MIRSILENEEIEIGILEYIPDEAQTPLLSLLNHTDPRIAIETIRALGDRVKDLPDYEPTLTKLLNHPDSYVVIKTIRALEGNLKKLASSGELNRLSASRDEGVKLAYQLAMISRF